MEKPNSKHRLYPTWVNMRARCHSAANPAFKHYGGRGIFVIAEWHAFAAFLADMGTSWREGLTLERRDNDGPYSAANCYWATRSVQTRNRRSNVFLEHDGRRMTIFDWATEIGMQPRSLWARIKSGWSTHDALTIPQIKNLKRASLVEYKGVTDTIYNHARREGLNPASVAQRVQRGGLSIQQAIETPFAQGGGKPNA